MYLPTESFDCEAKTSADANLNLKDGATLTLNACGKQEVVKDKTGYSEKKLMHVGLQLGVGDVDNDDEVKVKANIDYELAHLEGAAKIEGGPGVYGSVGVNINTGASIGTDGVEAKVLGFGFSLGPGGKFGVSTPFFSFGACSKCLCILHCAEFIHPDSVLFTFCFITLQLPIVLPRSNSA